MAQAVSGGHRGCFAHLGEVLVAQAVSGGHRGSDFTSVDLFKLSGEEVKYIEATPAKQITELQTK